MQSTEYIIYPLQNNVPFPEIRIQYKYTVRCVTTAAVCTQFRSRSYIPLTTMSVLGINYEAGKSIHQAITKATTNCIACFNIQIAMDAPFEDGNAAPEAVRNQGRTETHLGASDKETIRQLVPPLQEAVRLAFGSAGTEQSQLIIQIARGRSSEPFWQDVVQPALAQCSNVPPSNKLIRINGYRTLNYPKFETIDSSFVYVNIGMFGRLTTDVEPGTAFAVKTTYEIDPCSTEAQPMLLNILDHEMEDKSLAFLPSCSRF